MSASAVLRRADDVLRSRPASYPWSFLVLCGLFYGGVMGTFGGRGWQVAYSALKVPLLAAGDPGPEPAQLLRGEHAARASRRLRRGAAGDRGLAGRADDRPGGAGAA